MFWCERHGVRTSCVQDILVHMGQACPRLVKELEAGLSKRMSVQLCLSLLVVERGPHMEFLGLGLESQALASPFLLSHVFSHTLFSVSTLCLWGL